MCCAALTRACRPAFSYVRDLLRRRQAALLRGEAADAFAARVAAAHAADALPCGRAGALVAVTRAGATAAYRAAVLRVLDDATVAADTALAVL